MKKVFRYIENKNKIGIIILTILLNFTGIKAEKYLYYQSRIYSLVSAAELK